METSKEKVYLIAQLTMFATHEINVKESVVRLRNCARGCRLP